MVRDAARLARYGGLQDLEDLPPHPITSLYYYTITQVFIDPPELVVDVSAAREAWEAAIQCHKSQMKTRNYLDLVMSRARTLGAAIGVEYAAGLWLSDPIRLGSLGDIPFLRGTSSVKKLSIGITCYPSVGGSGIVASQLGSELARLGHKVHFISYEPPFRLDRKQPNVFFHQVELNEYKLFKYPDYTLPLAVKMVEVADKHKLDILHVHYAVPHATAALLATQIARDQMQHAPHVITTLHGTDITLLARDPNLGPIIKYSIESSCGVTAVSRSLKTETIQVLKSRKPIEVIYNFYRPKPPRKGRQEVRRALRVRKDDFLLIHMSNLRPVKRAQDVLRVLAELKDQPNIKLLILAGESFEPFFPQVRKGWGSKTG